MEKIKIGQIGIGHNHGEGKMLSFRKFPELFEIVGFSEDDDNWIQQRGSLEGYQGLKRYSKEELVDLCDAIIVETTVPDLTETALYCVQKGKHIHLDKPGSQTDLTVFEHMLKVAEEKNLVVQMGYMYRYNPAVKRVFELINSGKLGEIFSINAEMSTYHSVPYKKWLSTYKGGIQYILGSHLVDLIVKILGEPEQVTSFLKHTNLDDVDFADNNLSVLEYKHAIARVFTSSVEVNGWGRRQLVVTGSKGSVKIEPLENPITMTYSDLSITDKPYEDVKQTVAIDDIPKDSRYDSMVLDFYDYVTGKKQNPYSYAHDLTVQKVLMQMIAKDVIHPAQDFVYCPQSGDVKGKL